MQKRKQEIIVILLAFISLLFISVSAKLYLLKGIEEMHAFTATISNHPLEVSNAALKYQLELCRINDELDLMETLSTQERILQSVDIIETSKRGAEANFEIISRLILGEEGRVLESNTKQEFKEWESSINQTTSLYLKGAKAEAKSLLKRQEYLYEQLDESAAKINRYAREKGLFYQKRSDDLYEEFKRHSFFVIMIVIAAFGSLGYYVVRRVSTFMQKNEKLTDELLEKMRETRMIIQEAPNPIMLHDEDAKVVMVNAEWLKLTGYDAREIDTIEKWTQKNNGVKMDEGEFEVRTKDGKTMTWHFSSKPLGVINGKKTVISSAMDVTELKTKDELILMQSRYVAMGQMIGMIAHQWRQPLSIIAMDVNNTLVDMAMGKVDEKELEKSSRHILAQTEYLSNTINDFRNFFLVDNTIQSVSAQTVLEEIQSLLAASLKYHEISLEIQNKVLGAIAINKGELTQVLINVINNAKDAVAERAKDDKKIWIDVGEDENSIVFEVRDNGGGIKTSIMDKIFDPYFTTKNSLNGTGLGLYMSKLIVVQHFKGTITAQNKDEGVCFTVRLPKQSMGAKDA